MENLNNTTNIPEEVTDSNEANLPSDSDSLETVNPEEYSAAAMAREYVGKLFPFAHPGGTHKYIYGIVGFLLAATFFALPGIISILSFILPTKDFLNYISTNTHEFMSSTVTVMYIVLGWLVLGKLISAVYVSQPIIDLSGYKGVLDFIKKNFVRILFAVLLVLMTVSSLLCESPNTAFTNQTDGVFVWYNVALGAVLISMVKDKTHQRILLGIFAVSTLLTAFVMFRQYIMFYMRVDFDKIWVTDFSAIVPKVIDLRHVRGIFSNSNHAAYYLCLGTLCTAGLMITANKAWKRILWGIVFAILINVTILNDTLGSVLAITAVVLLIPVAFIKSEVKMYLRFVPMLIMVAVMVFVSAFPHLPMGSNTLRNSAKELFRIVEKMTDTGNDAKESTPTEKTEPQEDVASKSQDSSASADTESGEVIPPMPTVTADFEQRSTSGSESDNDNDNNFRESDMLESIPGISIPVPSPTKEAISEVKDASDDRWWLKNQELGTNRLGLWQYGIELMSRKPLLGYGVNGAAKLFATSVSGLREPSSRVHNEYLQIGIDCGIPAMLVHLTALITVVCYFFAGMKKKTLTPIQRILFIMFAAYAISAFTGICAYYTACYFYLILALLVSTFEGTVREYAVPEKNDKPVLSTENEETPADEPSDFNDGTEETSTVDSE